jgi:excisionase family DNA binding protein
VTPRRALVLVDVYYEPLGRLARATGRPRGGGPEGSNLNWLRPGDEAEMLESLAGAGLIVVSVADDGGDPFSDRPWGCGCSDASDVSAHHGTERVTFRGMVRAEQWLGTPAASSYLGVGLRKLYRLIDQGDIPAYQMGRVLRVKQQDLDAYLESARVEPGSLRHLYPVGDGQA